MLWESIVSVIRSLEGPYKWYVIALIAIVLSGLLTRVILKTIKWFLILLAIGIIAAAIFVYAVR